MAVLLSLYHNIQPNKNNTYYLHTGLSTFKGFLAPYLSRELTADNYRINANIIKINNAGLYSYDNITYACEEVIENDTTKYIRFYFVDAVTYQSGYATLTISIDLWATYISQAQITNIHVTRCNRLIDKPIFDNVKVAYDKPLLLSVDSDGAQNGIATPTYLNTYMNINRYYLVMAINYNAKQNLTGDNVASTTSLFGIRLDAIRNAYIEGIDPETATGEDFDLYYNKSAVEMARDFAGGVFGIASTGFSKNDARVVSAYIIDSTFISTSGWTTSLSSVSIYKKGEKTIEAQFLETKQYTDSLYIRNISLNYKVFAGLNYGGLQLNRIDNESYVKVYIRVTCNVSNVEVTLIQGDNQEDITSAFELTITNNVSQTTPLRAIANAVGRTASLIGGAKKGYEKAGALGAGASVAESLAGMVADYSINSQVRGNGDAVITYGGYQTYVLVPYKACAYVSIDDENENARNKGANFSKYISSLNDLLTNNNYTLLGSGSRINTFVSASCNVDGIPSEASDFIKNTLLNGIYLELVT